MPLSQPARNYVQSVEDASRTLNIGDAFQMLYSNNGALVFTVPPDVFGQGTQISLCDFDGGTPVFAAGAGVTLNSAGGLGPTAQYAVVSIIAVEPSLGANTFIVVGSV